MSDSMLSVPLLSDVGGPCVNATFKLMRRSLEAVMFIRPDGLTIQPDFSFSWMFVVAAIIFAYVLYRLYGLLFVPLNRVKRLGDVGYVPENSQMTMREMANIVQKRRVVGDVPPVYPNGWFAILESRDLKRGEVKDFSCLGKTLAVFRGEDGRSHAIDAYCPHNGANMAVGGVVKGSCLECPFHGWKFRGDNGKCVDIPCLDEQSNIPEVVKVNSYSTLERNGFIHLWFHAEGMDPTWEPPEIEEISSGEWTYRGRSEHIFNAHIQELPENGADVAHLFHLHGPIVAAGVDLRYTHRKLWSFAEHVWDVKWYQDPDPDRKHVGLVELSHTIKICGFRFNFLDLKVVIQQIGPAVSHLTYESPLFGRGAYLQMLVPIGPLRQRLIHHVYANNKFPTFIAKFLLYGESLHVRPYIFCST